jgi:hypothetical protein
MNIYKYGTKIIFNDGDIKGIIIGVIIRDKHIEYEIAYFLNSIHYVQWFCEHEFKADTKKNMAIGYLNKSKDIK